MHFELWIQSQKWFLWYAKFDTGMYIHVLVPVVQTYWISDRNTCIRSMGNLLKFDVRSYLLALEDPVLMEKQFINLNKTSP